MKRALMLTGDINLMNVTDPQVPFARVKDTLRQPGRDVELEAHADAFGARVTPDEDP